MFKKLLFVGLSLLVLSLNSIASTVSGAQVTYRYLGSNKFEITYKIYRDCRGTPSNYVDYAIRCVSTTSTKNLKATRVKIEDINYTCPTQTTICPTNQTYTGTLPAFEEHTFMDTLDFNGSESSFKSCCLIQIGTGACCRTGAITTGAGGNDFWVYSTLDLCNASSNSSPVFNFKPILTAVEGEKMTRSFSARDTIDNDSLSYKFTDPKTSWNGKTNWSGSLDSKNPFEAYYPASYNRANGPKPEANPPYGIYLDPISGNLIAMPVKSGEHTVMAVSVAEWRKDSKGKYIQIGEVVMDIGLIIFSQVNHMPTIDAKSRYNLCEGQTFKLDIATDDQPYNQPPPFSNLQNDTVRLTFYKGVKAAKYSINNSAAKLPVGNFEWTPASGDSKKLPYTFSVMAVDNNCPLSGVLMKTIALYVYPKINVSSNLNKINNYTYATSINVSNRSYAYVSGKYITTNVQEDIRNYYFKSSGDLYSTSETDTIIFKKNGWYHIHQTFLSETDCNSTTLKDSVLISNIPEVYFGVTTLGQYTDTSACKGQMMRNISKVLNVKRPVSYTWKIGKFTKTDTLGYFDYAYQKTDTLFLSIKDANGLSNSTFRTVFVTDIPSIQAGQDLTKCQENTVKLKGKSLINETLGWEWSKNSTVLSMSDSLFTSAPGTYILKGTNKYACSVYDTLSVSNFKTIPIELLSGVYCQSQNEINQSKIISGNPSLLFKSINFQLLQTLPKLGGGFNNLSDLLTDNNPGPGYDFSIGFSDSKITWTNAIRDSLIFSALAIDTNGCKSSDSMFVTLIKMPILHISKKLKEACINVAFNLDSFASTSSTYKWLPYNRQGFGTWPSVNPLSSGAIQAGYFSVPGVYKVKFEANNFFCFKSDSVTFTVLPKPSPKIGIYKNASTIKFRDETINEKSRKWYINNAFFSSEDTLLLSKSFVHLQPIKLEVIDNSGCTNDTTIVVNTQIYVIPIHRSNLSLFPNPAKNEIILNQLGAWVPSRYEIYDKLGKMLLSGETHSQQETIVLKDMESGSYYLKFMSEGNTVFIPFIKINP